MRKGYLSLLLWGFGISALGTLPLGTLNVASMQISMAKGWQAGALYALACVLVEVTYVRISLVGINWIRHHERLLKMLDWMAFLVVATLAVSSFMAAGKPVGEAKNILINNNMNVFVLGLLMSAVNPMQIPFWFGWSTVLFSKDILQHSNQHYNWYMLGIGLGSLAGLAVFILSGQLLLKTMNENGQLINYLIAGIFTLTALIFLGKIILNKGAAAALRKKGLEVDDAGGSGD